jgi:hypothetical protein
MKQDGMADAEAFELLGAIAPHLCRAVLIGNAIEHKSTEASQGFSDLLDAAVRAQSLARTAQST